MLDARELRFNAEFDAVFSNAVLHWIPEAVQVIAGVAQALTPRGRFVAEFGGKGNIQRVVEGFHRAFSTLGMHEPDGVSPWFYPSVGEYAGLLERHGLECVRPRCSIGRRCWRRENVDWKIGFDCSGKRSLKRWAKRIRSDGFEKSNASAGVNCL